MRRTDVVCRSRPGYVLLVVLLTLASIGTLVALVLVSVRRQVREVENRGAVSRARWAERGVEAAITAAVVRAVQGDSVAADSPAWRLLDQAVTELPVDVAGCAWSVVSSGATLDINAIPPEELRRFVAAAGTPALQQEAISDAILDWRDPDDEPRPRGAEREWYVANHGFAPRNGPFRDARELLEVRGVAELPAAVRERVLTSVGVTNGPVDLVHAPSVVLRALPGFTDPAVQVLIDMRRRSPLEIGLNSLSGALVGPAKDTLNAHLSELLGTTTVEPSAWIARASCGASGTQVRAVGEITYVRTSSKVAVAERRGWVE